MPGQPVLTAGAKPGQTGTAQEDSSDSAGVPSSYIFKCIGLCSLYILISAILIEYNKYLMHKDRFPFAMALTTCHMSMTLFWSYLLYWIAPSLYSAMPRTEGRRPELLRWFVPLGCLFALGLACSNKAYLYCNVAFLQFMKEANVALVFGLGVFVGIQECSRSKLFILAWILLGAFMAVHGQVEFVWVGFLVQALSQLGECGKTVLGEKIMQGLKLDPMTYTMFMSPICLSILIVMTGATWEHEVFARLKVWWPVLLPNACLAFLLNVTVAVIIKECSAITFILSGLVKDMVIVLASVYLFNETVVRQQLMGFAICLAGIVLWSHMRVHPHSALVRSVQIGLGEIRQSEKAELSQLLEKKSQVV